MVFDIGNDRILQGRQVVIRFIEGLEVIAFGLLHIAPVVPCLKGFQIAKINAVGGNKVVKKLPVGCGLYRLQPVAHIGRNRLGGIHKELAKAAVLDFRVKGA